MPFRTGVVRNGTAVTRMFWRGFMTANLPRRPVHSGWV